jgi:DnaJ family protein C protein 16
METFVSIVTSANYEEFINEDLQKNKVILFSNKKSTPPLFKALSKEYKGKLLFGQVRQSDE